MVAGVTNARPLVDPGVKDQLDSPSPVVFDQRQPHIGRLDADTVSKSLQPVQVFPLTKFYSVGYSQSRIIVKKHTIKVFVRCS